MRIGIGEKEVKLAWLVVGLLILPAGLPASKALQATQEQHSVAQRAENEDSQQPSAAMEEANQDPAQEKQDREQERLDREQEKRDREQERVDRLEELYDDGREALDDNSYKEAEKNFSELVKMNGPQTDAALYWLAYAQNRQGKKDAALGTIADLKKRFPQSRWKKDAEALEIEVHSSTGAKANPEAQGDEDLKMLALQGLMNSDPGKAIPMVEKMLNGSASPKDKSKALFVLAQSGSPEAQEVLARVAKGQSNPDMQRKAIQYLATFGGQRAGQTLADVYASSNDISAKGAIIHSYLISGDRE